MTSPPVFLVVEDGREYTDRFERLLGQQGRFRFVRAGSAAEALAGAAAGGVAGLLLDLDFRRTPPHQLIDDGGNGAAAHADSERRRLAAVQGILILRALRRAAVTLPALLFADLDDDGGQVGYLEGELSPLRVVPSSVGLQEIGGLLDRIAAAGAL